MYGYEDGGKGGYLVRFAKGRRLPYPGTACRSIVPPDELLGPPCMVGGEHNAHVHHGEI
jgi:hypothetical protein